MNLATTTNIAALGCIEQVGRETQHARGNRSTLLLVSIEQRTRAAIDDSVQFPAQAVRILNAGVESLAACWRMNVCGVTDQKHATDAIPIREPGIHAVRRSP